MDRAHTWAPDFTRSVPRRSHPPGPYPCFRPPWNHGPSATSTFGGIGISAQHIYASRCHVLTHLVRGPSSYVGAWGWTARTRGRRTSQRASHDDRTHPGAYVGAALHKECPTTITPTPAGDPVPRPSGDHGLRSLAGPVSQPSTSTRRGAIRPTVHCFPRRAPIADRPRRALSMFHVKHSGSHFRSPPCPSTRCAHPTSRPGGANRAPCGCA